MSRTDRRITVFVSSTSEDLQDYRAVARLVIHDVGWIPEMMEHFGAMATPTVPACMEKLGDCDLMLLIVAFRRGWVPSVGQGGNGQDSITALELAHARARNIPVIAMMAQTNWPGDLWEDDGEARAWVRKFRAELNLPAQFFDYESPAAKESERLPEFRAKLRIALVNHRERLLAARAPASPARMDLLDSARAALASGRCIPFVGQGVYGDGPLSTKALIDALGDLTAHEPYLATAAEFRERFLRSRDAFLHHVEKILEQQAGGAPPPAVHEMLGRLAPPLIVSTSADLVLEERLEASGHRVAIVCHVIRSGDGAHDGKLLVFQGLADGAPRLCLADQLELRPGKDGCIVYKPLGSPLLHRRLDPDLEIDTVVLTEADHLVLLGRLENEATRVPTAFSRHFQRYPLLFLGYPMDVWHFRLVVQVFQAVGTTNRSSASLAVRVPTSAMEELAWQRLGVDLLPMDPNDLVQRLAGAPGGQP